MASFIGSDTRASIWAAASEILSHGPLSDSGSNDATGLALGYVQSGKTTSITALLAAAADDGYRIIIALLGSTNLLLDQNTGRIEEAIIAGRKDYRWVTMRNARGQESTRAIDDWLKRDRVLLLPLLKHAGRINDLTKAISRSTATDYPVLVIDDEADQASLNTSVSESELSKTYAALSGLRSALREHIYVQYTATPYAPLLLDLDDKLQPEFVTLLHPGPGYTGGREFFVDSAETVIRSIPTQDEQAAKSLPLRLPKSLEAALANFLVGSAMLLALPEARAPISMLIHSTQRNDVQARYHFLVERQVRKWQREIEEAKDFDSLPHIFRDEWAALMAAGAETPDPDELLNSLRRAVREATCWLVNSESALKSIEWNVTPVHILIGGNKLDRGFTVEGLTVTYMNRPTSPQIDTLEQRLARSDIARSSSRTVNSSLRREHSKSCERSSSRSTTSARNSGMFLTQVAQSTIGHLMSVSFSRKVQSQPGAASSAPFNRSMRAGPVGTVSVAPASNWITSRSMNRSLIRSVYEMLRVSRLADLHSRSLACRLPR